MNFLDRQIIFILMQHKEHICKKGSHSFFIVIHSISAFGDVIKQLFVGAAVCCLKHRLVVHRAGGRKPCRWSLRWRNSVAGATLWGAVDAVGALALLAAWLLNESAACCKTCAGSAETGARLGGG